MANYDHKLDLMSFIGARQVPLKIRERLTDKDGNFIETEEEYAKVPVLWYSCIPNEPNGIEVKSDGREGKPDVQKTAAEKAAEMRLIYRNYSGMTARVAFSEFDLPNSSKLLQYSRNKLLQRGEQETAYNVPCRELRPRYKKDFQEAKRKRYEEQLKAQHPEWTSLSDQGVSLPQGTERNELTRAINAKFPYSIGTGYLREPMQQAQQASPYVAQPTAQYTQPAAQYAAPTESPYEDGFDLDLPF